MQNLVAEIRGLRGSIPEYIRCMVARRLARAIQRSMNDKVKALRFLQCCGLRAGEPRVACDLELPRTRLTQFIDRWLSVVGHYNEEGQWERLPPEVDAMRRNMLAELMVACGVHQHEIQRVIIRASAATDLDAELNMVFAGYDTLPATT